MDALSPSWPVPEEVRALLLLDALPGVGPRTLKRAVEAAGSARAALRLGPEACRRLLGELAAAARTDPARVADVDRGLALARARGMHVVHWGDPAYPARLRALADPPPVLFLMGRTSLLSRGGTALVGARRATARGRDVAFGLGRALGAAGHPVVSGLALGVDGQAHRGALAGGGPTVAVVGTGLDRVHPRSHASLFRRIAESGLVVSEFLPGTPALPHHFPRRNRVLAALADRVVVVEAGSRSGALITVDHALDLGRDVWAVPGPIDVTACAGSNALLRDGARALVDVGDFVAEVADGSAPEQAGRPPPEGRRGEVLRLLQAGPTGADQVARTLRLTPGTALSLLVELEMTGWVRRGPGPVYRLAV